MLRDWMAGEDIVGFAVVWKSEKIVREWHGQKSYIDVHVSTVNTRMYSRFGPNRLFITRGDCKEITGQCKSVPGPSA